MPHGPTQSDLAVETGIPQTTLSHWVRRSINVLPVSDKNTPGSASGSRRPEDWTAQERLRVVIEAGKLSDQELGEFLRREGLHEETLEAWREAALEALRPAPRGMKPAADGKKIKELERELARKDKALAEAAALLILKKKAQAIWGGEDDDTDGKPEK
jgi:hypothetical protein